MPPTVHTLRYTAPRAEWQAELYSKATPQQAWYWTCRSLAAAYLAMGQVCPHAARAWRDLPMTTHCRWQLARVPDALTVHFRPVALWMLLVGCHTCATAGRPEDFLSAAVYEQLEDAPNGDQRWMWHCQRPGCTMTGLHDSYRWAIEAVQLHNRATDHRALEEELTPA